MKTLDWETLESLYRAIVKDVPKSDVWTLKRDNTEPINLMACKRKKHPKPRK